jgi:hypothetical protein
MLLHESWQGMDFMNVFLAVNNKFKFQANFYPWDEFFSSKNKEKIVIYQ